MLEKEYIYTLLYYFYDYCIVVYFIIVAIYLNYVALSCIVLNTMLSQARQSRAGSNESQQLG